MKLIQLLFAFALLGMPAVHAGDAPAPAGHWEGAITVPDGQLAIKVDLVREGVVWIGTIDIPAQHTHGFKLDGVLVLGRTVKFCMPGVPGDPQFSGTLSDDGKTLAGDFTQGGAEFAFRLTHQEGDGQHAEAETGTETGGIGQGRVGDPALHQTNEAPEAGIVRRLRAATTGDKPGVAVLVARDGKILYQGGFGYADIAHRTPITPDTKFRIGSITKQFTAAAILRLAQDGKLSVSDPLSKFFPTFPNGDAITLRHLLTHTSGIHSYTDKPDIAEHVTKPVTPDKVIEWFQHDPPDFAPGKGFHYDNSGYFLLGVIVQKASGMSYTEYLRQTFFAPLGMKDTGVYVNSAPPAGAAIGYAWENGKADAVADWDMAWAGGAGALYSTVGDLWTWNQALFAGRVVNADSLREMTTPITLPPDADGMQYGFGLIMFTYNRLPVVGHGGGLPGWASDLVEFPEQHCTVVALTNAMPSLPGTGPAHLALDLAGKFLAADVKNAPQPAVDASIDPKVYADYVGTYDYRSGILTVSVEGDRLYAQLTGQRAFQLFPKSAGHYFIKEVDAELDFLRDAQGKVTAIHHTQNGQGFRAPRLEVPELTPQQLDGFAGRYEYGPKAVMTITRIGGYLFAQLTGQPRMPIFPTVDNTFEWHVVRAKVRFVTDAAGKVIKAVHTQNDRTFDAPRME
ncbi:MAG TPA: serine hydrolase [Opitutaceae bacterium]|nr:serine hydrolase [Opitutaceae bacterium]